MKTQFSPIEPLKQEDESQASSLFLQFPELMLVENRLQESVNRAHGTIKDNFARLLFSGGKRIRPIITLQSAKCFGPLNTAAINAAVAAELIHMASLIHDDVLDHANLRRGVPTANALHGNQIAVLIGDYIFAEAFQILSSEHLLKSMTYLVEAIQGMCHGEIQQAEDRFNLDEDEESYFKRITEKTGLLISSCSRAGAATTNASDEEIESLGQYGLYLGFAYQIIDDILDFSSSQDVCGKPVASDLANGYITLPVIYLLKNPLYKTWIREMLAKGTLSESDIQKITQVLISSEALDDAFNTALQCVHTAVASLERIPPSPAKDFLINIAYKVVYRKK